MSKHALKFEIESKTVAEFRALNKTGELVLRPEYQRQAVWPDAAKISLMETILLGFPIPEIYLSYETTADGEQTASVVDGQQRLTALLEFLDNQYTLDDLEDESLGKLFNGMLFRDLPDGVRTEFFQYRFPIRRLSNLGDEFVRAVFARVNRVNMVLTDQELRNALLPGPFNDFLKDCATHDLTEVSGIFSGERRKRGGDLEFFAEIFGTCIFGLANKKQELDERYDKISVDYEIYSERADIFIDLLTLLKTAIKWEGRTRWSNIVDMFTLLNVTWEFRSELSEASPADIDELRKILDLFQRAVSSYKRSETHGTLVSDLSKRLHIADAEIEAAVAAYTSGIRNSSDLGSRRIRHRQLKSIISRTMRIPEKT